MSRFQHLSRLFLVDILLLAVLLLPGCRQPDDDSSGVTLPEQQSLSGQPEVTQEVFGYSVEDLSDIGGYLPALDEGRLLVAPPVDWHKASRSKDYLARFLFDQNRRLPLPRITVEVSEAEEGDPRNLTREKLVAYAESVLKRMDAKLRRTVRGRVEPLMLGSIPCVRYEVPKTFRNGERMVRADCEVVQTIREGRVYTVLLDVNVATLIEYRADAYAVMATMKFPLAQDRDAAEKQDEDAAEAKDTAEQKDTAEESSQDGEEPTS